MTFCFLCCYHPSPYHHDNIKPNSGALGVKWGKGAWDTNIQNVLLPNLPDFSASVLSVAYTPYFLSPLVQPLQSTLQGFCVGVAVLHLSKEGGEI